MTPVPPFYRTDIEPNGMCWAEYVWTVLSRTHVSSGPLLFHDPPTRREYNAVPKGTTVVVYHRDYRVCHVAHPEAFWGGASMHGLQNAIRGFNKMLRFLTAVINVPS